MANEQKRPTPVLILLLAVAVLLPLLYVAGIGPAVWLVENDYVSQQTFGVAYAPLLWLMSLVPTCGNALERYIRLWEAL
jgi:hypothetical protein